MFNWKIIIGSVCTILLLTSLNKIYILQPMQAKITQAQMEQKLLQAKLQLAPSWRRDTSKIQNKEVDWNATLQHMVQKEQLQLLSMQVQQVVIKSTDVLMIHLQLQGAQMAIFNMWLALLTSEMPIVITKLDIKSNQTTNFTMSITMLMLKHISLIPISKPSIKAHPILCQANMSPLDVPLESFSMHGYMSQSNRQQALLAAGLNVSTVVSVGDAIGEERAVVTKISPRDVCVILANHHLQSIPMEV